MIIYENHCCDCAVPGYPCIGDSCPFVNVPVYYCDFCDDIYAEFVINEGHYCRKCAEKCLEEEFRSLTILERAKILEIELESLEE